MVWVQRSATYLGSSTSIDVWCEILLKHAAYMQYEKCKIT
jgi:hypothetical protein